jgi:hypothetical protein
MEHFLENETIECAKKNMDVLLGPENQANRVESETKGKNRSRSKFWQVADGANSKRMLQKDCSSNF